MRIRPALAVPGIAAALLLAAPGTSATAAPSGPAGIPSQKAAAPATCAAKALRLRAEQSADPRVLHVRVTNRSARACTVDRIPTVTFGDLDGAALPKPAGESGPYRLAGGRSAYASVLTIADRADPEARRVRSVTVSADPSLAGRSFTARELGAGATVRVWEPVTTWWKPSAAAADRALGLR
ncbi:DUF4232 domain-containing protein [Streptomyces sp. NPDC002131]|uniref:DUF4232 domain-containing protein n=1 Tax=Streptomyces sp. NPDC002131 TaxID=3154535 RepID=UPI003324257C